MDNCVSRARRTQRGGSALAAAVPLRGGKWNPDLILPMMIIDIPYGITARRQNDLAIMRVMLRTICIYCIIHWPQRHNSLGIQSISSYYN